jgi:hypothetical protein
MQQNETGFSLASTHIGPGVDDYREGFAVDWLREDLDARFGQTRCGRKRGVRYG